MNDYLVEPRPTLKRWLAGERIGPLPKRGADQEPPELSFEFFPPRTEALEQQLWTCSTAVGAACSAFCFRPTYGAGGTTHARRRKLDAGATRAITQYFFDTSTYLRFLEHCLAAGITAPIVPGIMPVSNYAQAVKFSAMCGATVPPWLGHMFEGTEMIPSSAGP